jgi:hypothetical protein
VRKSPARCRRECEAIRAEDQFFGRFNTLNTKEDFDIHGQMDKAMDAREFLMGPGDGGPG